MKSINRLLVREHLQQILNVAVFVGIFLVFVACGDDIKNEPIITIDITIGEFDVHAVPLENSNNPNQGPLGSGSLSFFFSGNDSGTFNVSGSLATNQKQNDGVGALIGPFEVQDVQGEGFSMLGFHPIGNDKAEIFLIGASGNVTPLQSLVPGNYPIGPSAPFTGFYLMGIKIVEFWAGDKDLIKAADKAYVISQGILTIGIRDSTHLTGSFSGTAALQPDNQSQTTLSRSLNPLMSK
ncbi:MAG: hypothetical protein ACE5HI_13190 [bacterium]